MWESRGYGILLWKAGGASTISVLQLFDLDIVGPFTNPSVLVGSCHIVGDPSAQSTFPQPLDLIEVLILQLHCSIFSQDPEEIDKAEECSKRNYIRQRPFFGLSSNIPRGR